MRTQSPKTLHHFARVTCCGLGLLSLVTVTTACDAAGEFDDAMLDDETYEDDAMLDDEALGDEPYEDDQALDDEAPDDEEMLDDEPSEYEEATMLVAQSDPQEADALDAPWVGGFGGEYFELECPLGEVVIGTVQSPTQAGTFVGQFGVICGPQNLVAAGQAVPYNDQWVIWSSHHDTIDFGWLQFPVDINAGHAPRIVFDNFYRAPQSTAALCGDGYRVNGVGVRAGAYVDRIRYLACDRLTPAPLPATQTVWVNVGGWGGTNQTSTCPDYIDGNVLHDQVSNGLRFRSANWVDGFGLLCRDD